MESDVESSSDEEREIWRNDDRKLDPDETLQFSPECYDMYHTMQLDWPCLSFDIILDDLGGCRTEFPHQCYLICGTQAQNKDDCSLYVLKISGLHKMELGESESPEPPKMQYRNTPHPGIVNRVKSCPLAKQLVCTMSDDGNSYIWDINKQLSNLENQDSGIEKSTPLFKNKLHSNEGYAVDWNRNSIGTLATGDINGNLILWKPIQGGWDLSKIYNKVHKKSIEDIQWQSGNQSDQILATASVDGNIRIFDLRTPETPTISISINPINDINCISWNPNKNDMLLSGDENGNAFVWDIRHPNLPLAELKWHNQPITSVTWHPIEQSVCACSSRDDSISIWDLSVEAESKDKNLPEQLMFIHMGQTEINEVAYHPLIPSVIISTASDGLNIFKCANI